MQRYRRFRWVARSPTLPRGCPRRGRRGPAVSRTELNPVSFLYRSVGDPSRARRGCTPRPPLHLRESWASASTVSPPRCAAAGWSRHDRVAALCPNVPALLELHHGVPAAGGVLVAINTRLSSPEIRHILEHSGARILFVDAELESLVAEPPAGVEMIRVDDDGQSTDPYEQLLAEGSPAGVAVAAARRGGADRDRLHVRYDRSAEGRRLHVPRRLPERARRGHRGGPRASPGVPVDAADVPLQRLVLPVGRDGGERDARLPAPGGSRR